jgi:hypothetical protein
LEREAGGHEYFPASQHQSLQTPRTGVFPHRVHVVEDYETDIEKRWWMAGEVETANVPPGSRRACRGTLANDFDDKMGDPSSSTPRHLQSRPGPPMGGHTELRFKYWLKGRPAARPALQPVERLPPPSDPERTASRLLAAGQSRPDRDARPDGSGGPLSEGERIDDIQFYADASAELIVDDLVLYEPLTVSLAPETPISFPKHILFAAGFDTGRQGKEWPGEFEIATPEKPGVGRPPDRSPTPRGTIPGCASRSGALVRCPAPPSRCASGPGCRKGSPSRWPWGPDPG